MFAIINADKDGVSTVRFATTKLAANQIRIHMLLKLMEDTANENIPVADIDDFLASVNCKEDFDNTVEAVMEYIVHNELEDKFIKWIHSLNNCSSFKDDTGTTVEITEGVFTEISIWDQNDTITY